MKEAAQDPLIGRTIAGKYRIEARIGEGGMGRVYRARHIVTDKVVALKVLLEDLAAYPSFVERFLHEARAAAYITHPHAINIIDCGRDGDVVYLLMEYIEGRTLTELMQQEGPLSPPRVARILSQICAALADAHAHSIVHRDLKPDNIILQRVAGERDYVKVLDFGIAKVLDEQKRGRLPASRNLFIGTPEYASPEQCNSKSPTALSDIYSLGVIAYEMLTGHPPFEGDPLEVMLKHASVEPPPLRRYRPDLSREIEAVVLRALRKDPAERPPSALDFARQFEDAVRLSGAHPTQAIESTPTVAGQTPETRLQRRAAPTESAARPDHTKERNRSSRPARRRVVAGVLSLGALALVIGGGVAGHRFYRWYRTMPPLPSPPAVRVDPAPLSLVDPVEAALKLFDEGNREGAVHQLRTVIQQSAFTQPKAHCLLGAIYLDQGELAGAESEFLLALEQTGGTQPEAHLGLGELLSERGDEDGALKEFHAAIEHSQGRLLRAQVALGRLLLQRGKTEDAEGAFSAVIRQAGDTADDVLEVGKVLLLRRQYELAVRELRRAVALKKGFFPEAYLYLGLTLLEAGDPPAAVELLRTAVAQRGGNYPAARYALGLALYRQGDDAGALTELRTARRLRGGFYPQAQAALGTMLADLAVADYDGAERELQAAITSRGGRFPQAEHALGLLYFLRLGRLDAARKVWTVADDPDARQMLTASRDAVALLARTAPVSRPLLASLPAGGTVSFQFALTPLDGRAAVAFRIGDSGVAVKVERAADDGRPADRPSLTIRAVRLNGRKEEPLDLVPFTGRLTDAFAGRLGVTLEPSAVVLTLNGSEIVRLKPLPDASLTITLTGGRAVVYNFAGLERSSGSVYYRRGLERLRYGGAQAITQPAGAGQADRRGTRGRNSSNGHIRQHRATALRTSSGSLSAR